MLEMPFNNEAIMDRIKYYFNHRQSAKLAILNKESTKQEIIISFNINYNTDQIYKEISALFKNIRIGDWKYQTFKKGSQAFLTTNKPHENLCILFQKLISVRVVQYKYFESENQLTPISLKFPELFPYVKNMELKGIYITENTIKVWSNMKNLKLLIVRNYYIGNQIKSIDFATILKQVNSLDIRKYKSNGQNKLIDAIFMIKKKYNRVSLDIFPFQKMEVLFENDTSSRLQVVFKNLNTDQNYLLQNLNKPLKFLSFLSIHGDINENNLLLDKILINSVSMRSLIFYTHYLEDTYDYTKIFCYIPNLRSFQCVTRGNIYFFSNLMSELSKHCKRIKVLRILAWYFSGIFDLESTFNGLKYLRKLTMLTSTKTSPELYVKMLKKHPYITQIDILDDSKISHDIVAKMLKNNKYLQLIKLPALSSKSKKKIKTLCFRRKIDILYSY